MEGKKIIGCQSEIPQPKESWKHIENWNEAEIAAFKAWLDAAAIYLQNHLKELENESPSQTSLWKAHGTPNTL